MTPRHAKYHTEGRADVPCNGCTACCHSVIMLLPDGGDAVETYDHEIKTIAPGLTGPVLKQNADGSCIYLKDNACSIHERAPLICQSFDCRGWFLKFTRHERRKMMAQGGEYQRAIFEAGRARLNE